jgi:hypothetical protein
MADNLPPEIRALPAYQLGFADGRDLGLREALDVLTQERIRQTLLQDTYPGNPAEAFRHAYAAARLADAAKVIANRFRQ